jgi:hypothetical protein
MYGTSYGTEPGIRRLAGSQLAEQPGHVPLVFAALPAARHTNHYTGRLILAHCGMALPLMPKIYAAAETNLIAGIQWPHASN